MDTNQYMEMFIDEGKEHLQSCNEHLLELEKNPEDLTIVNEIFRSAHTLKGMSATMGYTDIADLTHVMENILDAIRNSKLKVTAEMLDVVFESVVYLEEMVFDIESGGTGEKDVSELINLLNRIEKGDTSVSLAKSEVAATALVVSENSTLNALQYDEFEMTVITQSFEQEYGAYEITVRLREDCVLKAARVFMVFEILESAGDIVKSFPSVEKLEDEVFDQEFTAVLITKENADAIQAKVMKVSEIVEVLITPITSQSLLDRKQVKDDELSLEKTANKDVKKKDQTNSTNNSRPAQVHSGNRTIRVNIERLDVLMNLFEELVIDRGRLESISTDLHHPELTETVERITRISGDLQGIILNMRMIPVETVFNRFPTMVRQLARDLDKKVNLEIIGAQTELDRTVIDEIGDPLVHLIRNALDHGIESPEERLAKGKPEEGTVTLSAYHSGNNVFIELEDDGAGVNRERVLAKAIANDIVTEEVAETMTDRQVGELILASGFSTADTISDVSGRGVGLDVVRTTIESLGGHISIDSTEGQGSLFQVQLPLTLSIISVMLVELAEEVYAIPLTSIIETAIIETTEIMNAHNQQVIDFRGNIIPLLNLKEIFEMPGSDAKEAEYQSVVIVRKGEKLAGLIVDSFIGQQEIVLKSLGNYLNSVFAISGATILGDGQVALIVDCNALIK